MTHFSTATCHTFQPPLTPALPEFKAMKRLLVLASAVTLAGTLDVQAALITSSFGTVSGADDDNQMPMWGMTYQIITTGQYTNPTDGVMTHTLSPTDAGATQVLMQELSWQRGSGSWQIGDILMQNDVYLAIMDGFTVDANGAITSIGTLKGVSTNNVDAPPALAQMTWTFDNVPLEVGSSYQFVFSAVAANPTQADIGFASLEMRFPIPFVQLLAETQLVGWDANGVTYKANMEPSFSMNYSSIPEPATILLLGLAGVAAALLRRMKYAE